jgi:aconitate hydratase
MGVVPLQFLPGQNAQILALRGDEPITVQGLSALADDDIPSHAEVVAGDKTFRVQIGIASHRELAYLRNGGVLPTVLQRALR